MRFSIGIYRIDLLTLRLKVLLCLLLSASFSCACFAQDSKKIQDRVDYINQYNSLAVKQMKKYRIPASITLAQACLESGNGKSTLAVKANNHFGIKCHDDWKGESIKHDDDAPGECFRKYDSPEESFEDHSKYLSAKKRYASLFSLKLTDYKEWAHGLKAAGYATNPNYANELIRIIEDYDLTRYDSGKYTGDISEADMSEEKIASSVTEQEQENISMNAVPMQVSKLYSYSMDRQIYSDDGRAYIFAVEGDTYSSIAAEYHLFNREIYKYNGVDKKSVLQPGTIVYIEKQKKSR